MIQVILLIMGAALPIVKIFAEPVTPEVFEVRTIVTYRGLLLLIWITFSNHLPGIVWDKITYPSPNFKAALLKFGDGYVISFNILISHIHAGIKVNPC